MGSGATVDYNVVVWLGCQHYLWKETLSHLVHASVQLDHEDLRTADVGAGTWCQ